MRRKSTCYKINTNFRKVYIHLMNANFRGVYVYVHIFNTKLMLYLMLPYSLLLSDIFQEISADISGMLQRGAEELL